MIVTILKSVEEVHDINPQSIITVENEGAKSMFKGTFYSVMCEQSPTPEPQSHQPS